MSRKKQMRRITDLKKIELHDAVIKKIKINYPKKTIKIRLNFYENENDRDRKPALISFSEIESITQICDSVDEFLENAAAGHVIDWKPANGAGKTYIYWIDGCLFIDAARTDFYVVSSKASND
jgi:hypothetical protein